jgi:predicted nuclease with RNAse H fold
LVLSVGPPEGKDPEIYYLNMAALLPLCFSFIPSLKRIGMAVFRNLHKNV